MKIYQYLCTYCSAYIESQQNVGLFDEAGELLCEDCYEKIVIKRYYRNECDLIGDYDMYPNELNVVNLKKWGVIKWNEYRKSNIGEFPDLSDTDLSNMNLEGVDLSNSKLDGSNFKYSDLSNSDLSHCSLISTELYKAKLSGVKFENSKFIDTVMINADLIGSSFKNADIQDVNLRAAILLNTDFSYALIFNTEFSGAQLCGAKFYKTEFENAELNFADLSYIDCRETTFINSTLTGVMIEKIVVMDSKFNKSSAEYLFLDREKKIKVEFKNKEEFNSFIKLMDFHGNIEPAQMPCVFLSYARADSPQVLAVDKWLREKGISVILDERDFYIGENIRNEIINSLKRSDVIVCFISKHSMDRPYPKFEREIANNLRIDGKANVIYFKLEEIETDIEHEHRLYIPGHRLSYEKACEQLWQGILGLKRQPKSLDVKPFVEAKENWTKILKVDK